MLLTSCNIAAKRLKAGCCLAIHVENMWGYMEEGDMVNAQCAREKALMLDSLICTLARWKPTAPPCFGCEGGSDLVGINDGRIFSLLTHDGKKIKIT
jgi:hypothetical protein